MGQNVQIRLMGACMIMVNGETFDNLAAKSRKGVSLMEYLILHRKKGVPVYRLIRELGGDRRNDNPESALKTMVCRFRAMLNSLSPGLGACIVSEQSAYRWESLPGVYVDVLELMDLLESYKKEPSDKERAALFRRIMEVYEGDLFETGDISNGASQISWLHREYLDAVYAFVEQLKAAEAYNEICEVCRAAMKIDEMDEQLHIELMRAMVSLNRVSDAMTEYRHVTRMSRQLLDTDPSEDMQKSYQQLIEAGRKVSFNLDTIRNELAEKEGEHHGPFFCDYQTFKEFYNLSMRNLERLGSSMFLAVVMVGDDTVSSVSRESAIAGLTEILRNNLRKGDIVTRFSPTIVAMLLPTVNYETGGMVMERIEHMFYQECSGNSVAMHYRISPLGGNMVS